MESICALPEISSRPSTSNISKGELRSLADIKQMPLNPLPRAATSLVSYYTERHDAWKSSVISSLESIASNSSLRLSHLFYKDPINVLLKVQNGTIGTSALFEKNATSVIGTLGAASNAALKNTFFSSEFKDPWNTLPAFAKKISSIIKAVERLQLLCSVHGDHSIVWNWEILHAIRVRKDSLGIYTCMRPASLTSYCGLAG